MQKNGYHACWQFESVFIVEKPLSPSDSQHHLGCAQKSFGRVLKGEGMGGERKNCLPENL